MTKFYSSTTLSIFSFFLSGSIIGSAQAQSAPFDRLDDDIVVTATRVPTSLSEVGSTVSVISAQDILDNQYSFAAEALRDTAGVEIARNGGPGAATAARIRGAASGQTLVMIDGIVVNDPSAPQGGFNFANVDVADIARIEVLHGPQSLLYGADAIGGVIAITTKKDRTGTSAYLEGGSRGTIRGGATALLSDDNAYGRLTVSGTRTDGISRASVGTEQDGYRNISASFSGGIKLGNDWQAELIGRYSDSHAEIDGYAPPDFSIGDTDDIEDTTEFAVAGRLKQVTNHYNGTLTVSYSDIDRVNLNNGFETYSADGDRLSTDYLGALSVSESIRIIGGGEIERSSVVVSGVDESATAGAVFAMIEAKPSEVLTLSAGARRDEFSNFDGATTARIAAVLEAHENLFLRASWGQGFRAPSLFELNYDQFGTVPNPDLRPEKANGFDFGIEKLIGAHRFSATFFQTRVKDQIDFDFAGSGYFNIDRARARGVETVADFSLHENLSARASYTFTDAVDLDTDLPLLRQPKHKAVATISYAPVQSLNLSTSILYNGPEADFPVGNDDFIRIDLRAAYALSEKIEIYGRIENLTDTEYEDVSGYGEAGISGFGGLRVRL
ncbi:TonB-dependent receptor [Hyphococcus formosus]|uniref:TonB-dependent receptor plug domain-containing protein n=1 Tax=Hyphococcus formosus TaxID=3143534 RepID=UPI00398A5CF6